MEASETLCRLCGLEKETLSDYFNDSSLKADLMTFLPLEVRFLFDKCSGFLKYIFFQIKAESPFPKVVCCDCKNDFKILRNFFVKLNEGQALLAEKLSQVDNMVIQMPNLLADKRCLFRDKYPCIPKAMPKPRLAKPRKKPLPVLFPLSEKRCRKLPLRLAESVQGFDLDNIFVKEENKEEVENQQDQSQRTVSPVGTKPYTVGPSRRYQGRQRTKCDICQKTFKLQGRLAHHR